MAGASGGWEGLEIGAQAEGENMNYHSVLRGLCMIYYEYVTENFLYVYV